MLAGVIYFLFNNEPFEPLTRITRWRGRLPDDRQLWERIRHGDSHAFDEFYRQNAPRLEVFLRRVVGNRQVAEELMQDTFVQIWRQPNGFDPERGALRAYLFGIGRKCAAEWCRTNRSTDHHQSDGDAAPTVICRTESASEVADALGRLPEEQRTLLWLREVEGQSYAELAQVLDIPLGTVRSRLFAARGALRKIWQSSRNQTQEDA